MLREIDDAGAAAARYARSGDLRAEVESLARPLVERGETPGIVVGVLSPDGGAQFFGYGVTDRGSGRTPDGDTLFPIGSVSKGFLAAATALLVDEGVLSWDETLDKLLPPNTPLSADAKKITLLQLATHTSGLPRQPNTVQMMAYLTQYLFTGENFYRHMDRDYELAYLADFTAPPKVDSRPSNLGYGILAYAVQLRTGLSLAALLEQKLSRPLGLRSTGYAPEALPGYATRARGHSGDQPKFIPRGKPVPDWSLTDMMEGAAGVYSSARDLLAFAAAHLSRATRLNAALADTMKPLFMRPREAPAIGWITDEIDGRRITYQVGVVAGYACYLGLDAERRTAVVVLENSLNWTDKVGHNLLLRMAVAEDMRRQDQAPGY
ncbi:MAG TPA: serine hydrolase domain-containing protein [Candidatus Binatia bacterium]